LATFYELGLQAIRNSDETNRVTWRRIRNEMEEQYIELTKMKFLDPNLGQAHVQGALKKLYNDIVTKYQELETGA